MYFIKLILLIQSGYAFLETKKMEVEENPREPQLRPEDPKKYETWKQFKLLIWKNWLIFRRNPRSSMFQIITPIFICLYMLLLQNVLNIG